MYLGDYVVRDLMTSPVSTLKRSSTLEEVQELMAEGRFRHVPIVDDDDELVGLITHRDVVRVLGELSVARQQVRLEKFTADRVMTARVECADPDEPLLDAADRMLENKYGCLPVVEGRHLVGILTEADFVKFVAGQRDED